MVENTSKDQTPEDCREISRNPYASGENADVFFKTLLKIMSNSANRFNYVRVIEKNTELVKWIYDVTKFVIDSDLKTRIYLVMNGISEIPVCPTCGKSCGPTIISYSAGFRKFCNAKCACADKTVQDKRKATCITRYGTASVSADPDIRRKIENTLMTKYGVDNAAKIAGSAEKIKQTKFEKYGDANYNNPEKSKRTCIEKYGKEYSAQTDEMKRKSADTCMKRYGMTNGGWCEKSKYKITETNREKLGVDYPMQAESVKNKAENTFLEKYGVKTPFKLDRVKNINATRTKTNSYNAFILNNPFDEPCFSLEEYIKRSDDSELLAFKCRKCGKKFQASHHDGFHSRCPDCWPAFHGTSDEEKELADFLKSSISCEIIENSRKIIPPFELDIYIPSRKLAIEFDGLYWHNEMYKSKDYHLNKTNACEESGITLIHVFENEWLYKKDLVKSRLLTILGEHTEPVFARKCDVREIPNKDANSFFDVNHIQGHIDSSVNLGLFFENRLVAAMGFSKCRFSEKYEWELTRYASKAGTRVIGGAGRLLKNFERRYNPKSLISYADRRWSRGDMYEKLGFKFAHNSRPDYWYFKPNSFMLESRMKYQKHMLRKKLEIFDPEKTEKQNMSDNGYQMIYDCGNKVYIKEYV